MLPASKVTGTLSTLWQKRSRHDSHLKSKILEIKGSSQSCGNAIPFTTPRNLSLIRFKNKESTYHASGWKEHTPFMNMLTKVFSIDGERKPLWIVIWVKQDTAITGKEGVPKKSLIYNYITSPNPERERILQEFEQILLDAFFTAKRFIAERDDIQYGLELMYGKEWAMRLNKDTSIEISHNTIDILLEAIRDDDTETIAKRKQFFKSAFVHEMAHKLREEFVENDDVGQEIASHAAELLACEGDNPASDEKFEFAIKNPVGSYMQDMVAALKVLEQKFLINKDCLYKPRNFTPKELNKAMKSIPERKREKVLQKIAKEIIYASPIELLKTAARVDRAPAKAKTGTYSGGPR